MYIYVCVCVWEILVYRKSIFFIVELKVYDCFIIN